MSVIEISAKLNAELAKKPPPRERVTVPGPGVYDLLESDYHADPCEVPSLNASIGKILVMQSPLHAHNAHPRLGGAKRKPTSKMEFGTICHSLLLGGRDVVTVTGFKDWKKKAAQQAREAIRAAGKCAILEDDKVRADAVVAAVASKLERRGSPIRGLTEQTIVWIELADDGTEVLCRAQLDNVELDTGLFRDFKFGETANPKRCSKMMAGMGYYIQHAAYSSAVKAVVPELTGRINGLYSFAETHQPHAVTTLQPDGMMRTLGQKAWRHAVNTWATCMKSGEWPEYSEAIETASAKSWDFAEWSEDDEDI